MILGHYLTVKKLRPKFKPSVEKIKSTLVWVWFPGIYLEMLDEELLSYMGDLLPWSRLTRDLLRNFELDSYECVWKLIWRSHYFLR